MNTEPHHPLPGDGRLEEVLAAYLRAEERGAPPTRAEWLDHYPELAEELAHFLDNRKHVERLVGGPGGDPHPLGRFGDYELLQVLGRGGMGVVYKARQVSLGRTVALKMVLGGGHASSEDVLRFVREAEAVAQLDHPYIVPLYEAGQLDGQPFFTMKLIEGGSLDEHQECFGGDPVASAALVEKIADAVHAAHRHGILHRDLKPGNILLDAAGQPHITDFGLAKRLGGDQRLTDTGTVLGTACYMAPEQASGRTQHLTTAVDVHSLGVILYELLTGVPPYEGETPLETLHRVQEEEARPIRALNPRVDRDLEAICLKCLEKDPRRRYGSAADLSDDLRRWQRGEPARARPLGSAARCWRWCRRHPERAGLMAAAVILLAGALGAALVIARSRATRLEEETLAANVYAARGVASTVLLTLDRLSEPVLETANAPRLTERLAQYEEAKADPDMRLGLRKELHRFLCGAHGEQRLQARELGPHGAGAPFQNWQLLDRDGRLIAHSVEQPVVDGEGFHERDYFAGAVARTGQTGRAAVHISRVYLSHNDRLHKFAISVAVPGDPRTRKVLGVLAATLTTTATLGSLRLDDERRKVILIGRQDPSLPLDRVEAAAGAEYVVVLHPAYARGVRAVPFRGNRLTALHQLDPSRSLFLLPDLGEAFDRELVTDSNYADPVGDEDARYGGRWLAGFAPVGRTEYVVMVQQRYEETIGPELTLAWNMTFWTGVALALATLLIGAGLRWWVFRHQRYQLTMVRRAG